MHTIKGHHITLINSHPTDTQTVTSRGGTTNTGFRAAVAWVFVLLIPLVGMILCSTVAGRARVAGSSTKAMDAGMLIAAVLMVAEILVVVPVVMGFTR